MGYAAQFNRVDRDGDYMEGNLQFLDGVSIVEFLAAVGGSMRAGIRVNGNDLEFYDVTAGTWVKLSSFSPTSTAQPPFYERFTATTGQSSFTLTAGTYQTGRNMLHVFVNGVRVPNNYITEDSSTQFTLSSPYAPMSGGEFVEAMVIRAEPVETHTVAVSSGDTTPGYLEDKLIAGSGVTLTKVNAGGDEGVRIDAVSGAGGDNAIIEHYANFVPGGTIYLIKDLTPYPERYFYLFLSTGFTGASAPTATAQYVVDKDTMRVTGGYCSPYIAVQFTDADLSAAPAEVCKTHGGDYITLQTSGKSLIFAGNSYLYTFIRKA